MPNGLVAMRKDSIFADERPQISDFIFDQAVVDVFPDMLRRSVPGYEYILTMLGVFAQRYIQPNSCVYDLGCSLGAATLALQRYQPYDSIKYIGIDNSLAMINQCQINLTKHIPETQVELRCEDIQHSKIDHASLTVLNFTLQFLPRDSRLELLKKLYNGLNSGGALILSEKVRFADSGQQQLFTDTYHDFKRANHYSDMEISQKRAALEKVLLPDTQEQHIERLKAENPQGTVVIQADKKSTTDTLIKVMDSARAAGVYDVSIAAQEA